MCGRGIPFFQGKNFNITERLERTSKKSILGIPKSEVSLGVLELSYGPGEPFRFPPIAPIDGQ